MNNNHSIETATGKRGAKTQCWYKITGMPGWKRKQLGLPAFGSLSCVPRDVQQALPACERANSSISLS